MFSYKKNCFFLYVELYDLIYLHLHLYISVYHIISFIEISNIHYIFDAVWLCRWATIAVQWNWKGPSRSLCKVTIRIQMDIYNSWGKSWVSMFSSVFLVNFFSQFFMIMLYDYASVENIQKYINIWSTWPSPCDYFFNEMSFIIRHGTKRLKPRMRHAYEGFINRGPLNLVWKCKWH